MDQNRIRMRERRPHGLVRRRGPGLVEGQRLGVQALGGQGPREIAGRFGGAGMQKPAGRPSLGDQGGQRSTSPSAEVTFVKPACRAAAALASPTANTGRIRSADRAAKAARRWRW